MVYKGITLEMTTTQGLNRNQQIIATSRRAAEISFWEPMLILFALLETLTSISLLLLKVKATFNFPFTFFTLNIFSLTLSTCISSYSSERVQMRNLKKLVLSLLLGFNSKNAVEFSTLYEFMPAPCRVRGAPERGTRCSLDTVAAASRFQTYCHPSFLWLYG